MAQSAEPPRTPPEWLAAGHAILDEYSAALRRYGVELDPGLRLEPGDDPIPYYEPETRTISIGAPDADTIKGRLYWMFLARYWGGSGVEEGMRGMADQLPFLVVHEITHHLRHRYGAPIDNDFVEEQVVNEVALAFLREHPVYRTTVPRLVEMAAHSHGREQTGEGPRHHAGFRLDLAEVLVAQRLIDRSRLDELRALAADAHVPLSELLESAGVVPESNLQAAASTRDEAEAYFNRRYMANAVEYVSFFDAWLPAYLDRGDLPSLAVALELHVLTSDWETTRVAETRTTLEAALLHPVEAIAAAAAEAIAAEVGEGAVDHLLVGAARDRPVVQAAALRALAVAAPGDERAGALARDLLSAPNADVRAAAATVLLREPGAVEPRAHAALAALTRSAVPGERLAALRAVANLDGSVAHRIAERGLEDGDDRVRREACMALLRNAAPGPLPRLVAALDDPSGPVRDAAERALRGAGPEAAAALASCRGGLEARVTATLLLNEAAAGDRSRARVRDLLTELAMRGEWTRAARAGVAPAVLLADALIEEERRLGRLALQLAGSVSNPIAMRLALRGLESDLPERRSTALDLARTAVPEDLAPLVEVFLSAETQAPSSLPEPLTAYPDPVIAELAREAAGPKREDAHVLTSTEKVMFLRAVPIFAPLEVRDLHGLVESFVTERHAAGQRVFAAGEEPRALYVIAAGRVAIERPSPGGDTRIAELAPRQAFGEVSLLSGSTHTNHALALRDTTLLALARDDLTRLALRRPEILMEIVRVLGQRLRSANAELSAEPGTPVPPPATERGLSVIWNRSALGSLEDDDGDA